MAGTVVQVEETVRGAADGPAGVPCEDWAGRRRLTLAVLRDLSACRGSKACFSLRAAAGRGGACCVLRISDCRPCVTHYAVHAFPFGVSSVPFIPPPEGKDFPSPRVESGSSCLPGPRAQPRGAI